MKAAGDKSKGSRIGEVMLMVYLICVVAIALLRALVGWPTVSQLASTPALLAHGEWWRLATSALVVNGPTLPQLLAIGVLGTFAIYLGGSAVFWAAAVAGHVIGTLTAYIGLSVLWSIDHTAGARFLTDPDYGVSLVWCATLGAFAGLAWLGKRRDWRRPERPILALAAFAVVAVVTLFSDGMAAVQHVVAFLVGLGVLALAEQKSKFSARAPRRRPRLS